MDLVWIFNCVGRFVQDMKRDVQVERPYES